MPTASIELPDGSKVTIEGSVKEVEHLLQVYRGERNGKETPANRHKDKGKAAQSSPSRSKASSEEPVDSVNHAELINKIYDCDETTKIESEILDKRNALNRVLLPLFISQKYFEDSAWFFNWRYFQDYH